MQLRTRLDGGGTPQPTAWGIDSEYGRLRDVLIGPIDHYAWRPESNAVAARSQRIGLRFDRAAALTQYQEMIDAYQEAGVRVHRLPAEDGLPYQLFARDSSVMTPWGAVIMQLAKPFRRGEYATCLRFYLDAGIPIYDLMSAGNIEGGDFMVLKPGVAVCGYSGDRSISPAVEQLRRWFEREGWEFHTYAFDPHFLHLDVQLGVIAADLAALCVEAVEPEFGAWLKSRGFQILEVSYQEAMDMGCNLVALGAERVLIPATNRRLIEHCRAQGLTVYDPDVSMIANGGGSIHCMCQPLRRDPG